METVMRRIEDVMREMHAEDAGPPGPSA